MKQNNKPRKRKGYIRIVLLILFVIISVKMIIGIKSSAIETVMVQNGEAKVEEMTTGIIVRKEQVIKAPISGYISFMARENERIPVSTKLLEVRRERIDGDILERYNEIMAKINEIESVDMETQPDIARSLSTISSFIASGNLSGVYHEKEKLIRELGSKQDLQGAENIDKLVEERKNLERIIGDGIKSENASFSGIPVYSLDGYEEVLNAGHLMEIDPSRFKEVKTSRIDRTKKVEADQPVLKLVDNHEWYLVVRLSAEFAGDIEKGDTVTLELDSQEQNEIRAVVKDVSPKEESILAAFTINDYFPGFLEKRAVEVNVVKDRYSGYVIPVRALVEKDGKTGVLVHIEGRAVFREVVLKGDNGETAVIDTVDSRSQLKLYDRIIINPDIFGGGYDGH